MVQETSRAREFSAIIPTNATVDELYIDLLKMCLTRYFPDTYEPLGPVSEDASLPRRIAYSLLRKALGKDRDIARKVDLEQRAEGKDVPSSGETMIGLKRLDNLHYCVSDVLNRGIEGDFIEAGVWRGGAGIFMRGLLKAYGDTRRKVLLADSFRGPPAPNLERYPEDKIFASGRHRHQIATLEIVKRNFQWYGMLDDQVVFLPGFFKETLHDAALNQFALIRLDADLYESTIDSLEFLYPKLSVGGYVIIDDYNDFPGARRATADFRKKQGINEDIIDIDWTGAYWKRTK